jgi:hypothetical protein
MPILFHFNFHWLSIIRSLRCHLFSLETKIVNANSTEGFWLDREIKSCYFCNILV